MRGVDEGGTRRTKKKSQAVKGMRDGRCHRRGVGAD